MPGLKFNVCSLIMNASSSPLPSRREFLKTSSRAAVAGALVAPFVLTSRSRAEEGPVLRVGLIGCGGRGTGAASQALLAHPGNRLVAVADAFEDRLQQSLQTLRTNHPSQVSVEPDHCFVGLDAYLKLMATDVDVVLLASPPGFRPSHLKAAVDAGKHVFAEKPMAVDAPGVRSVLESARAAKARGLALVAGFCYRYNEGCRAIVQRIHDGEIGEVRSLYNTFNTGYVWSPFPRDPGWTETQLQVKNWYYYTYLSGDHIVEQACHCLDKMAWVMKEVPPLKCVATGGRQQRIDPEFGNIFDHFAVVFDYPNGVKGYHFCRQQAGCVNDNSDYITGTKGVGQFVRAFSGPYVIKDNQDNLTWRFRGEDQVGMYQREHNELFASIRAGQPIHDGEWMAHSTLLAIMGRMAAYTGQAITWEQAMNSQEKLFPDGLHSWDTRVEVPPPAMPGRTPFV